MDLLSKIHKAKNKIARKTYKQVFDMHIPSEEEPEEEKVQYVQDDNKKESLDNLINELQEFPEEKKKADSEQKDPIWKNIIKVFKK